MPALPKGELRQLVADARTDEALKQLLELLAGAPALREPYNALNLLCGQFNSAVNNFQLNLIDFKEFSRETSRVGRAFQQHLDQLPDEIAPPKSKAPAPEVMLRETLQAVAADADWEYDVFFSFSSQDLDEARNFCHALRGYGLRVFFSADDLRLRAGHDFSDLIEKALKGSRHFLLYCSPHSMESEWVELERDTFFQQYHLKDKRRRSFHIAEGPGFSDDLVPSFYRRYQRLRDPETLLHALADFQPFAAPAPVSAPPPAPVAKLPEIAKPSAADGHAWEFTTDADTRTAYKKYLTRFPQGFYVAEAHARLEAFDADDTAWEFASDAGTEKALQKYLLKYPNGLHAAEARQKLTVFEQEREAEAARQKQKIAQEEKNRETAERKRKALENARAGKAAARNQREQEEAERKRQEAAAALALMQQEAARKQEEEAERRRLDPFRDLMVLIKGGTFDMGDTFGDGGEEEQPVHKITLSDFYLCKYPVTQGQWKAIMGENPSHFSGDDMLPVEMVSWDDALDFIQKLKEITSLQYRLPTEAEWEYAAREGGKKVRFGNGKDIADPAEINFDGSENYKQPYSVVGEYLYKTTTPVAQFKPNALGLYDMSGNVWEWCADWYSAYASAVQTNPTGPSSRSYHVLRGGSWAFGAWYCRVANRTGNAPGCRDGNYGFRLASTIQPTTKQAEGGTIDGAAKW